MNKRYAILAGLTLLAASSAFAQPAAGEGLAAIRAAGVLKCGVGFEFKPFSFTQDPKTRQLVGYDVDICNAIAAKIGVKPELVPITGATRVTDLQSGRFDLADVVAARRYEMDGVIIVEPVALAPVFRAQFPPSQTLHELRMAKPPNILHEL